MPVKIEYIEKLLHVTPLPVYLTFICIAVLCIVIAISVKGVRGGAKVSSIILAVLYGFIVICTTVVCRHSYSGRGIIYVPFWSYIAIINGKLSLIEENIMNVIAFLPLGLFVSIGIRKLKWRHTAIVGFCLSVAIELMQYYFEKGQCEIDDVIHNTLGCVIGYYIVKVAFKSFRRYSQDEL